MHSIATSRTSTAQVRNNGRKELRDMDICNRHYSVHIQEFIVCGVILLLWSERFTDYFHHRSASIKENALHYLSIRINSWPSAYTYTQWISRVRVIGVWIEGHQLLHTYRTWIPSWFLALQQAARTLNIFGNYGAGDLLPVALPGPSSQTTRPKHCRIARGARSPADLRAGAARDRIILLYLNHNIFGYSLKWMPSSKSSGWSSLQKCVQLITYIHEYIALFSTYLSLDILDQWFSTF